MKKSIVFLSLLLFLSYVVNAQIITVDNNVNSAAMYTDLQAALDAANAGDTIFISGSATNYSASNLAKQLVIIGSGINDENLTVKIAKVQSFKFTNSAASGSIFLNLRIDALTYLVGVNITDIIIRRCKVPNISLTTGFHNWILENNIMGTMIGNSNSGIIIRNNIFLIGGLGIRNFSASSSLTIYNNLFLGTNGHPLDQVSNAQVKYNIFYFSSGVGGGNFGTTKDASVIRNNVSNTTNALYGGLADDGSNITADPLFNDGDEVFSFTSDYRLQVGSPALTASDTGEEIGIFGGVAPFPIDIASGFFSNPNNFIPAIFDMEILSSDVPLNGSFEVRIKAKTSN